MAAFGLSTDTRILCLSPAAVAQPLRNILVAEGFHASFNDDANAVVSTIHDFAPDIIILDAQLAGLRIHHLCECMRQATEAPILMLIPSTDVEQIVMALESGADECISRPCNPIELLVRMKALLRRAGRLSAVNFRLAGIDMYPEERRVEVDGTPVSLTTLEFDILLTLMSRPRAVFTRLHLFRLVWGTEWGSDGRLVDSHVCRLREKLATAGLTGSPISTVRGIGYVFRPDDGPATA